MQAALAPPSAAQTPATSRTGVFRRMVLLIKPYRGLFMVAVLLTILNAILGSARPYLFKLTLDGPVAQGLVHELRLWIVAITGLVLLNTLVAYYQTWLTNRLGQTLMNELRGQVFSHLLRLRLRYYDRTPIGTMQTRTVNDIQTLNQVFSEGLVTILGELLQLIGILGLMFYIDWRVTLVTLAILPLILLTTYVFQRKVKGAFERVRKYVAQLNAFLQEHITGMLVTQMFHRQKEESDRFRQVNRQHLKAHLDSVLYYSIFFPVVEILSALATALLVWYGAGAVLQEEISFGVLVSFMMYIQMFFRPIRLLADQFNTLQMGVVAADRLFKVLDTEEFIPDRKDGLGPEDLARQPAAVSFQGVGFHYLEGQPVLKDVSFHVPAGTTLALVGATGSGKSTILNVLMRMYDPTEGVVKVAGHNAQDYTLAALRGSMGLVLQDVFLFSGSIYDNVTLFNPAISLEQVRQAARAIGADHFIERLPGEYFYHVGERGATLSAGQRQMLSFLRVLVYDPKILLLDEATSNVDTETEELIQQALAAILKGRTSIIVAHRLSTIQRADQIAVMHRGQLVECGNHQELLAQGGLYKKLYLLQYGTRALA